jgi:hypothetical protein
VGASIVRIEVVQGVDVEKFGFLFRGVRGDPWPDKILSAVQSMWKVHPEAIPNTETPRNLIR